MIETVKPSMKGNLELADAKSYQNGNPAMVFFALAYAFMLYTTSNVPMVWIAVVRSSKKLAELKDAARNIQRYVRAYQFLATIHLIISVFVSGRVGLFMFGINLLMGFIATAVFFSIARRWFRNFIKQLGTRHLVIQKRVEQLTNTVLGLMVVACIVSGTYSVFSIIGIEHFCASGSLCIVIIFDDLTLLTSKCDNKIYFVSRVYVPSKQRLLFLSPSYGVLLLLLLSTKPRLCHTDVIYVDLRKQRAVRRQSYKAEVTGKTEVFHC